MTAARRSALLVAPLAVAALLWAHAFGAQEEQGFLDAYKAGVEAAATEDWPSAERLMRAAIAGRAQAAERLIRHLHLRPYVPHFYLGLALAEQGKCDQALEAFSESESQGVITGLAAEIAVLREREVRCRASLAAAAEAHQERQAVAVLVARAERTADAVARLAADPVLAEGWERGAPSLADRLAEARSAAAEARQRMEGEDPEPASLAAAADLARGALGQLAAIRRESELRREAAAERRDTTAARVERLLRAGRDLLAETRDLARDALELARRRSALAEAVERASGAKPGLPLPDLRELADLLERHAAEVRAAAAPPPEALLAAADAWLRGEPRTVLELLAGDDGSGSGVAFRDPWARAHAHLLRAAAAFALHRSQDDPGLALLEAARRDAAACRRLAPDLTPLPGAFPPRFRAFFAAVEPEPEPGGEGS